MQTILYNLGFLFLGATGAMMVFFRAASRYSPTSGSEILLEMLLCLIPFSLVLLCLWAAQQVPN